MPERTDLRDSARELLAVLDATETFLRVLASNHLPYSSVIAVERDAVRLAAELVAQLPARGVVADDATDELLTRAVVPMDLGPSAGLASSFEAEPLDDGPEAAADAYPALSDEEPTLAVRVPRDTLEALEHGDVDDEPWVEGDAPDDEAAAPATSGDAWVTYEELGEEEDEELYISVDDIEPAPVAEAAPPARGDQPSYVSYEDAGGELDIDDDLITQTGDLLAEDDDRATEFDDEGETLVVEMPVEQVSAPMDFSEVGEETLITIDDPLPLTALEEEVELELDEPAAFVEEVETFDLIPDLTDSALSLEPLDEEEETSIQALEDLRRVVESSQPAPERTAPRGTPRPVAARAGTPAGASARVKAGAGLYGNSGSVPTIRDGDAPRPRAAAIQLSANASSGRMVGLEEEEEPIEIGAVEDYDEELEMEYDDEDGGGFRLQVQEYDDDLEPYEEELEDEEVVIEAVAPARPQRRAPTAQEIAALFQRAREAAETGDMQRGTDLYSDVIDSDPENIDAYVGRGRLYLDLGDYSRAMSDFMIAEDLAPTNPEPQIAIGDLYFARKDYRKAIDYFNAALEVSPDHAMAFCRRGISHYYRKNYRDSLEDLQRAQEIDGDIPNIGTYINMARKKAKK